MMTRPIVLDHPRSHLSRSYLDVARLQEKAEYAGWGVHLWLVKEGGGNGGGLSLVPSTAQPDR